MKIERWEPEKHRPLVEAWTSSRRLPAGPPCIFPPTGVVVDDCAIMFLFFTDAPGLAILDCLITDPSVTHERRLAAAKAGFEHLMAEADSRGMQLVIGHTRFGLVMEALKHVGFHLMETGQTAFARIREAA